MTDAMVLALLSSIPPTLAALAAFIQSCRTAEKADDIHHLVNSSMTQVKTELELAQDKVAKLSQLLAETHAKDSPTKAREAVMAPEVPVIEPPSSRVKPKKKPRG